MTADIIIVDGNGYNEMIVDKMIVDRARPLVLIGS
jgi:hypothetical protein